MAPPCGQSPNHPRSRSTVHTAWERTNERRSRGPLPQPSLGTETQFAADFHGKNNTPHWGAPFHFCSGGASDWWWRGCIVACSCVFVCVCVRSSFLGVVRGRGEVSSWGGHAACGACVWECEFFRERIRNRRSVFTDECFFFRSKVNRKEWIAKLGQFKFFRGPKGLPRHHGRGRKSFVGVITVENEKKVKQVKIPTRNRLRVRKRSCRSEVDEKFPVIWISSRKIAAGKLEENQKVFPIQFAFLRWYFCGRARLQLRNKKKKKRKTNRKVLSEWESGKSLGISSHFHTLRNPSRKSKQ